MTPSCACSAAQHVLEPDESQLWGQMLEELSAEVFGWLGFKHAAAMMLTEFQVKRWAHGKKALWLTQVE